MGRRVAVAAAGALLAAAALTWWSSRGASRAAAPDAVRQACRFRTGDRLAYQGTIHAEAAGLLALPSQGGELLLPTHGDAEEKVRIDLQVVAADATQATVALRLERGDPAQVAAALVRITADCQVAEVLPHRALRAEPAEQIDEMVRSLGFRIPARADEDRQETDRYGDAQVRYARRGDHVARRVLRYLRVAGDNLGVARGHPAQIRVRDAWVEVTLGEGPWFAAQRQRLSLALEVDGKVQRRVEGDASWEQVPARDDLAIAADADDFGPSSGRAPTPQPPATGPEPGALATMSLEQVWADAMRRQGQALAPMPSARDLLVAWMQAKPGRARALAELWARGGLPRGARILIVSSLAALGAPEGRDALVWLHGHGAAAIADRRLAVDGLRAIDPPDAQVIEALRKAARSEEGYEDATGMLGNHSLLALGTVAGKAAPEDRALAQQTIAEALASEDPDRRREALHAVANGDPQPFLEAAKAARGTAESPELRAAAAAALRNLPFESLEPTYAPWLATEPDPGVLSGIGRALLHAQHAGYGPPAELCQAIYEAILRSEDPRAKRDLVVALGTAAGHDPAAKALLVKAFHAEQDPRAQLVYGRFATAQELASP